MHIISGKVAANHVHMFVSYRAQLAIIKLFQQLKGISSRVLLQEFVHLRKLYWGRHCWARGYMAISSGNITEDYSALYR